MQIMCAEALHTRFAWRPTWALLALVVAFLSGCAEPLSPEHKAAISRMQGLGGSVMFAEGGYSLNMANSRISDEDLKQLNDISNLKVLHLENTRISDEGLKELANVKSLTAVHLSGTPTSREARDALSQARPDLAVRQ